MDDSIEIYCTVQASERNNGIDKALFLVHPQRGGLSLGEYIASNLHRDRGELMPGENYIVTIRRAEPRLVKKMPGRPGSL